MCNKKVRKTVRWFIGAFLKTENRIIFELLACAKDEIKMEKIIKKNQYTLDKETIKAILGMLGIKINLNKIMVKTQEGVRYDMCKAWNDHKERGRREGEQVAIKKSVKVLVDSLKKFSTDIEAIYNVVLENELYKHITREQVEKYYYAK